MAIFHFDQNSFFLNYIFISEFETFDRNVNMLYLIWIHFLGF